MKSAIFLLPAVSIAIRKKVPSSKNISEKEASVIKKTGTRIGTAATATEGRPGVPVRIVGFGLACDIVGAGADPLLGNDLPGQQPSEQEGNGGNDDPPEDDFPKICCQ